jgi:hydrogenase maturation protease
VIPRPSILIIGYGNELRGDDAAGPVAARALAALNLPGVRVLVTQQLTPDLAETVAPSTAVIFIDATAEETRNAATLNRIQPDPEAVISNHISQPPGLLALAMALYGTAPPAWMARIPARGFDLGAGLSETAAQGVGQAVTAIREHMAGFRLD